MDSTEIQPESSGQAAAAEAFARLAGWIFREAQEEHDRRGAGVENAEDEAERVASITDADDAGRYLAGAAIVQVWQLDYDDATEVRRILHI